MGTTIKRLGAALGVAVISVATAFLVGMRTKSARVQRVVRKVNRGFMNPRAMESAGEPGAYASIVRHIGRVSGAVYETPVVVVDVDDAFVVALPYGDAADWVRNVLAAGGATIVHEGTEYVVDRPEVVPTPQVEHVFAESERRVQRMFRVDHCLLLRRPAS